MIIHEDIGIDEIGVYLMQNLFNGGVPHAVRPKSFFFFSLHASDIPSEKLELAIKMFGLSRDQVFMELDLLARGTIKDYSKYTMIRNVSGSY